MIRTRLPASVLLAGVLLTGCGGGGDPATPAATSAGATGTGSAGAGERPTGTPFTATLTGPETARAGQTVTVTVTNTGRLPNQFQLDLTPAGAATADPRSVALSPGQSAPIRLTVTTVPFDVNLEAASGGLGDFLDTLEIAAVG